MIFRFQISNHSPGMQPVRLIEQEMDDGLKNGNEVS